MDERKVHQLGIDLDAEPLRERVGRGRRTARDQ
jgi:hypothetical protein